ncbi:MAG TPA: hypothetical protein VFU05_08585 [Cyclobacteriaceae bacterium]|nr:hypothetical protein [Cyclobacteriaceae bacterium]
MEATSLISRILNAKNPQEIFSRLHYRKEYHSFVKLIHPDVCADPGSNEAITKLNLFKQQLEDQEKIEDDAGVIQVLNERSLRFTGDKTFLEKSLINYNRLNSLRDTTSQHFKKYLPSEMRMEGDALLLKNADRIVPLTHLQLSVEHVNWITSRILEFVSWLHQMGFSHNGINPESFYILPENHGIVCVSFYHMSALNESLATVSGRYLSWYPPIVLDKKTAIPYTDIITTKRTALYLLGDKSGNGIRLKKTCNNELIDFLTKPQHDAFTTYDEFRKLLLKLYGKPKFHTLNI